MFKKNLQNLNPIERDISIRLKNQDTIQGWDGCGSDNFCKVISYESL